MKKESWERTILLGNDTEKNDIFITASIKLRSENRLTWRLEPISEFLTLSIVGEIKTICGGQINNAILENIDNFKFYLSQDKVLDLLEIWKEYHLNDMQAGTMKQQFALRPFQHKYPEEFKNDWYEACCKYLKRIGLYEDRGYRFGSLWLIKPLPESIIRGIKVIFNDS